MKKLFFFAVFLLVLSLILYLSLFAFVNTRGKNVLADKVEAELGLRPEIGSLSMRFPLTLEVIDFKVGDLSFLKGEFSLSSNFYFFLPSLRFSRVYLDGLDLQVTRKDEAVFIDPVYRKEFSLNAPPAQLTEEKKQAQLETEPQKKANLEAGKLSIGIEEFNLQNSFIRYKDESGGRNLELVFFNLNLILENFHYPELTKFSFDFSSSLEKSDRILEDLILAKGWVDYPNRSMDVNLKLDSVPYGTFSAYYPPFWRLGNLGVKNAILSLSSSFESENNQLLVDTVITLDEIEYQEISEDQKSRLARKRMVKTVIGLLDDKEKGPHINFKVKTKMDSPKLGFDFIGKALINSLPLVSSRSITGESVGRAAAAVKEGAGRIRQMPQETIGKTIDTLKSAAEAIRNVFINADSQ